MVEWLTNVIRGAGKRMCLEKKGDFLGYSINCWCSLVSFTDVPMLIVTISVPIL